MKLKLSQSEIDTFEEQLNNDDAVAYFRRHSEHKFNIGDILIRKSRRMADGQWTVEIDENNAPVKWMYVYESKDGHGVVAQLDDDGEPDLEDAYSIADCSGTDNIFEVDPDYQDHLLIGRGQYDACKRARELKKLFEEYDSHNIKLIRRINLVNDANKVLSTLTPGQVIYFEPRCYSGDRLSQRVREIVRDHKYEVVRVRRVKMTSQQVSWYIEQDTTSRSKKKKSKPQSYYYYTVALKSLSGGYGYHVSRVNSMTAQSSVIMTGPVKSYESPI